MRPFYTILTNYGKTALAEALAAQQPLKIPHMAVGDGAGGYYDPTETQTNLRNEQWRGDLNDLRTDEELQGQVIAEAIIPHGIDGDWTAREIGLFDGKGGLVAVGKYPETYIPPKLSGAKSQIYINIVVKIDNVAAVELIINHDTVLASKQYVSDTTVGRKERIFTKRPAGMSLTDVVSVKDYGAEGDGVTDDTDAIDLARADSKIIFFPYTEKGYIYKKPVELVGESWIGEGVGRVWGNTAPTILFSGFTSVAAITSKTKTNYLKGLRFMPLSWDSQNGYLGSGLKVDGIINTQDCGFFGFKVNNYLSEYSGSNETWLCYHNNTWFGYSGEHGVDIKSGNGSVFINCSSNWSGATKFLENPTEKANYHGLNISSTLTEGYTSPEGFILIGGDWSYNAGYGLKVTSGHGGIFQPGYIELNLTGGAFFGGTAKAHDVNMGHIGQSVHFDLESPFTASTVGKYSRAPCSFKANGMDEGIGHRYGDNATTTPSLPLGSEGAVHKMLTTAWGGVYGSILKLMDKAGNMIFKGVSGDSRQMYIKMEDALFSDSRKKIHPIVTTGAIEVGTLPPAGADYANSFAFQALDRKLYYCYYNSTNFVWRAVW